MHTKITAENPHGYDRYGFAWQNVPQGGTAHLDFGCYDGAFLATLKSKGIPRLLGVDISQDAVRKAHEQFGDLEIMHISKTVPLPFEDAEFTSITVLDVIEHVDAQSALLGELNRVLMDDGTLIVTVPGRHIFSFLDTGNFKFRFPRLHRWYYCRKHSKATYEHRYVSNPDGLVGDVCAKKGWHEHFSREGLEKLLKSRGFTVVEFDGTGLFSRIIKNVNFLLGGLKPLQAFLRKIEALDTKFFESANLFCVARKERKNELSQ
ncbi:MAG: class I SAM-dependent methyltransferase [Planctomycetota bacterium]|jgi:SAM-dependent methyltransferase